MKRNVLLAVAVLVGLGLFTISARAQSAESFLGVVKAVSGSSITVEHGTIVGVFAVDPKTHISASGATSKTKENQAAGKPGLTVPDIVHVGDQVMVKYVFNDKANTMTASEIQVRVTLAKK